MDPATHKLCRFRADVVQKCDELTAAVAKQDVGESKLSCRIPNHVSQDLVSARLAMHRIYLLQANDIDVQPCELCSLDYLRQSCGINELLKLVQIRQAG